MENIKNVTFDEMRVGATAEFRRTLSQPDIELLAMVSGDVDPFHLTGEGAASARPDARTTEAVGGPGHHRGGPGDPAAGARDDDPPPGSPLPGHDHGRRRADGDCEGHREMPEGSRGRLRLPVYQPTGGDAWRRERPSWRHRLVRRIRRGGTTTGRIPPGRWLRTPFPSLRGNLAGRSAPSCTPATGIRCSDRSRLHGAD